MTDEAQNTQNTQAEAPAAAPKQELGYDPQISRERAEWYARKPDALESLMSELEKVTGDRAYVKADEYNELKSQVSNLARKDMVKEAMIEYGLERKHAKFIAGSTQDEINAAAKELADLLKATSESTMEEVRKNPKKYTPPQEPEKPEKVEKLEELLARLKRDGVRGDF